MVSQRELKKIAKKAREELYREHKTTREEDPRIIEGQCHENAFKVAERLYDKGIDCIFVWGSLGSPHNPPTIEEAEPAGSVHHWIEVPKSTISSCQSELDVSRNTIVIDPYALGNNKGDLYISEKLPSDYQRLKGGFIEYESWMKPTDFISMRAYRDLPENVFVFEKDEDI